MKPSRALAAIRDLCSLRLHPEVLVPAVLEALHQLVPSQRNLFDWTDAQGRLLRYFIEGPIDAEIARLYFHEFHNRREVEAMPAFAELRRMPAGVRSADELDHPGFFRTALYNEIWRPQAMRTRLEGVLRGGDGGLLGSLVLYRGPGDPRFTREDERQLAAVLPALAAGLQGQAALLGASERHVPSPDPAETLLLTLDGSVCHASAGAERLLWLAEGGITPAAVLAGAVGCGAPASPSRPTGLLPGPLPRPLPGPLLGMLMSNMRALAEAGPRRLLAPPPSITHETVAGQFVASGLLLRPARAGAEPLVQVTLRRLEPHRVALERALRRLPLTAGQAAVCRELHAGRTHAEIAGRLGVSPATVVDHVRKLYRTLELRSAQELHALLERDIAAA